MERKIKYKWNKKKFANNIFYLLLFTFDIIAYILIIIKLTNKLFY